MWILTFTRWCRYYSRGSAVTGHELDRLSQDARELAMLRPMNGWRSTGSGTRSELGREGLFGSAGLTTFRAFHGGRFSVRQCGTTTMPRRCVLKRGACTYQRLLLEEPCDEL